MKRSYRLRPTAEPFGAVARSRRMAACFRRVEAERCNDCVADDITLASRPFHGAEMNDFSLLPPERRRRLSVDSPKDQRTLERKKTHETEGKTHCGPYRRHPDGGGSRIRELQRRGLPRARQELPRTRDDSAGQRPSMGKVQVGPAGALAACRRTEDAGPDQAAIAATCAAIASDAVRPGDSMPKRLTRDGTGRPISKSGSAAGSFTRIPA